MSRRTVDQNWHHKDVRTTASILHLDLDAFFAAVEQRDKPSLRGKPVIVGGTGLRGVVSTASYEARVHGVRSAMSMSEARARCPNAAFLGGRFGAYREASAVVMAQLRLLSARVEQISIDEAYVDLSVAPDDSEAAPRSSTELTSLVTKLRRDVVQHTGGLSASVGVGSSKLIAKIASESAKPNGFVIIEPGSEHDLLDELAVDALPGVGPATATRLHGLGVRTIGDLLSIDADELIRSLGKAAGQVLFQLARAEDDRAVEPYREAKSISVEDTFAADIADRATLNQKAEQMARKIVNRLVKQRLSARTVTLKVRYHDFQTHTRSQTLTGPTDSAVTIAQTTQSLLARTDIGGGLRLLGVGVSGLTDWVQEELFSSAQPTRDDEPDNPVRSTGDAHEQPAKPVAPPVPADDRYLPGADVMHDVFGPGWVWGSGLGRVTVRFETRWTPPGPVKTFSINDPQLARCDETKVSRPR